MAIYKARRLEKRTQEELLRQHLPPTVSLLGAFDKSGIYGLLSGISSSELPDVVAGALAHHVNLSNLSPGDVALVPAVTLQNGLDALCRRVRNQYGEALDRRSFGVQIDGRVWRAGLSAVSEVGWLPAFVEGAGPDLRPRPDEALTLDGAADGGVMHAELGGDGVEAPVLGEEEPANLRVLLRGDHAGGSQRPSWRTSLKAPRPPRPTIPRLRNPAATGT